MAWLAVLAGFGLAACGGDDAPAEPDAALPDAGLADGAPGDGAPGDGAAQPVARPRVTPAVLTLDEGGDAASFAVTLEVPPSAAIELRVEVADASAIAAQPTTLRFTSDDYSTPQMVSVTPLDDSDNVDESTVVSVGGEGARDADVVVIVIDDEDVGIPDIEMLSLAPLVQFTPLLEMERFEVAGTAMTAADLQSASAQHSVAEKVLELGAQIGAERGGEPLALFADDEQEARAAQMPFRGKPADVAVLASGAARRAYVPLGGSLSVPGNEVAVYDLTTRAVSRVRVGIRPLQVFAHAASELLFVCNQYSNYISVIDGRTGTTLTSGGAPVLLPSDFHCSDLVAVERAPDAGEPDELALLVSNSFRRSVLAYELDRCASEPNSDVWTMTRRRGSRRAR
ncbi:YncE family protein [Haliangium ochraceum]|uniref:YncE family protein n=1 Tax=Haliangium ochraceum (strain DSM 14365 / JCM 11303 / SMP-2) TaxID=502025 RepID=D0LWX2_HALO1|nr:hypothetical protein [Haliangium ochraceum]ACY14219.1 hypothetical protein Hoch_1669 [Haliangium ochraceum DSM 14365]